ncbi:1,4-beta-D-glucan cellobiohydrolase-like protein [Microthyrium microscopicum]|uniref:Glucanase n=1 Tax=Microthyrium microscopicum TaxID=703497 RepID=A0A6A6UHB2_9PEZI|nr:1,4-beta-D-glucan cellobiohydrolase-like protein [Microthyrium microscopicum]
MHRAGLLVLSAIAAVNAQGVGKNTAEKHPSLNWKTCTKGGGCQSKKGEVTVDANWRWTHTEGTTKNCYDGNKWTSEVSDGKTAGTKCVVEGADYSGTYGIKAGGDSLSLKFLTKHQYGTNVGSRTYLMASENKYQQFNLLNKEFTFDVEFPTVGCGLNAALYFVSMDADGGQAKYSSNKAGAKYGTGYCDAQCPRDLKFINGIGNIEGWQPSKNDANAGVGPMGSCCAEMDIWEANAISAAVTPHSCTKTEQTMCKGDSCGGTYSSERYAGVCDADGCDFNSYRMGDPDFYGKGKTVDTNKKFTVVTQFIGNPLTEIKRFYVQNGKVIPNSESKLEGVKGNSITPEFCDAQKKLFGDNYGFKEKGGFKSMSDAMAKGMTLVMSIWDDHYSDMDWLDASMPKDKTGPGVKRGDCPAGEGAPATVEAKQGSATVTFSNIKFGDLNSTFGTGA